jgi:alpha,alpha-trehalose-phosphate synthase [UDP-forming]
MSLVIVSNRLPITLQRSGEAWTTQPASGGLVTAFMPLLRQWGGTWIGWPGVATGANPDLPALLADFGRREGYTVVPVPLTVDEHDQFYRGFCNEIIWPLFHDLHSLCNFVPAYWTSYQSVKQKYADVVAAAVRPEDFIWVQDYHLPGLGQCLRQRGLTNRLGFFLHIPFPPPDIFCKLPWRLEILRSLLDYDAIGLQTPRDLENLLDCLKRLCPEATPHCVGEMVRIHRGAEGRGTCIAGVFPIGIDFDEFGNASTNPDVEAVLGEMRRHLSGRQIILGLDRLDYTKGIPYRLRAFRLALERYPELHRAVNLLQVVVPSRESVAEYRDLKAEIERLVAQINGEFTLPGWVPIHHVFRSINRNDLLAFYQLADIALVTPLKDGMNLVAKEYCACQADGNGVLILSEFAGAAVQLAADAVLVNPYDLDNVAAAIRNAVFMTPEQRQPAMFRLRESIRAQSVQWWARSFLDACGVGAPSPSAAPASVRG